MSVRKFRQFEIWIEADGAPGCMNVEGAIFGNDMTLAEYNANVAKMTLAHTFSFEPEAGYDDPAPEMTDVQEQVFARQVYNAYMESHFKTLELLEDRTREHCPGCDGDHQ